MTRQIRKILFWVLWIVLPVLTSNWFSDPFLVPRWSMLAMFSGILVLSSLLGSKKILLPRSPLILYSATAFFAWQIVAVTYSPNFGLALDTFSQLVCVVSLILFVANEEIELKSLAAFSLIPMAIIFFGTASKALFDHSFFNGFDALGSALGQRNWVSVYLTLLIPLILSFEESSYTLSGDIATSFVITLLSYVIVLNRTRSAWVMLIFIFLGLILLKRKRELLRAGVGLVFGILLVLSLPNHLSWNSSHPYQDSLTSMTSLEKSSGRNRVWNDAAIIYRDSPFLGVGLGRAIENLRIKYSRDYEANPNRAPFVFYLMNDFLQAFVETGFFGGVAFLSLLICLALVSFKTKTVASLSISALLVDALVDYPFHRPETVLLFGVICGICLKNDLIYPFKMPRIWKTALVILCSIPLLVGGLKTTSYLLRSASAMTDRLEEYTRFQELKTAYRLWPWDSDWTPRLLSESWKNRNDTLANQFVSDSVRLWPTRLVTKLIQAKFARFQDNADAANLAYTEAFSLPGERCSLIAYADYLDWQYSKSFFKPVSERLLLRCKDHVDPAIEPAPFSGEQNIGWERSASSVELWRGNPLVLVRSDEREKNLLPYTYSSGKLAALLDLNVNDPRVSFSNAIPVGSDELLLAGSLPPPQDRPRLYTYNPKNMTARPINLSFEQGDSSEWGQKNVCASGPNSDKKYVSWTGNKGQFFSKLVRENQGEARLLPLGESKEEFYACVWADDGTFYGFQDPNYSPSLWSCHVGADIACTKTNFFDDLEVANKFFRVGNQLGVIGLKSGAQFTRAFFINQDHLDPVALPEITADVLDYDGSLTRYGQHGRYFLKPLSETSEIIYSSLKIGKNYYAVISNLKTPRSFGRWNMGKWQVIGLDKSHSEISTAPDVSEVEIPSGKGVSYPAYYFGPSNSKKVVLWWHGGKESVSPRYSAFFHALTSLGYGILAPNYPGSVGWGKAYEDLQFSRSDLFDIAQASVLFLKKRGAQKIVSWSVSGGSRVHEVMLRRGIQVDAMIDQVGGPNTIRIELAKKNHLPYFSVRGRYDPNRQFDEAADYFYNGNHFIENYDQFKTVMPEISEFLQSLEKP